MFTAETTFLDSNTDFSIDLTAAAPRSYDHTTGGGAYDDRTIGVDKDVVDSLRAELQVSTQSRTSSRWPWATRMGGEQGPNASKWTSIFRPTRRERRA